MSKKLTIILGYRNREVERVKRCLDSLSIQSDQNFNVIFVDYGSFMDKATKVKHLIDLYSFCKYIYNDTRGMPWNRSHALNTGILISEAKYTMTSDIDLIYSKHFVKEILRNVDENVELHANAYALPKKFNNWIKLNEKNNLKFLSRNLTAIGLVQVVLTDTLKAIRGFDEYYRIWGAEDEDLNQRLVKKGLTTKWLDLKSVPVYHQWHPNSGLRTKRNIPNGWQKNLGYYLKKNEENIVRNFDHSWGGILTVDSRKIFFHNDNNFFNRSLTLNDVPILQSINTIYKNFNELKSGESMKIEFKDEKLHYLKKSLLFRIINYFNSLSNRYNGPLLLTNDLTYFGNYEGTFDFRDMIMYFMLNNDNLIEDYYMEHDEEVFKIILIKS